MTAVVSTPTSVPIGHTEATVAVRRRTIDTVLTAAGAVFALVLFAAGGLLTWGSNFAEDYVYDELSSQNIVFPEAAALEEEGRTDLVKFAGATVNTGTRGRVVRQRLHRRHLQGDRRRQDLRRPRRRPERTRAHCRRGAKANAADLADAAGAARPP